MGYVIAAIVVLLIVGGFVLFLVTHATRKSNVSAADGPGAEQNPLGIVGSDDGSPAGDTSEHADERAPTPRRFDHDRDRAEATRPVVGGEAEGERATRGGA